MKNIEIIDDNVFIDGERWDEDDVSAVADIYEKMQVRKELINEVIRRLDYIPDDEQLEDLLNYYFDNKNCTVSVLKQIEDAVTFCLGIDRELEDDYGDSDEQDDYLGDS